MFGQRLQALCILACAFWPSSGFPAVAEGQVPDLTKTIDFERSEVFHLGPTGAKGWIYAADNFMTTDGEIHQLVRRLRRRLEKYSDFEYVQSVRGQGYKLVGFRK